MSRTVTPPGEIVPANLYEAGEIRKRMKLSERRWRDLLRGGLRMTRLGRAVLVKGSDLLTAIEQSRTSDHAAATRSSHDAPANDGAGGTATPAGNSNP